MQEQENKTETLSAVNNPKYVKKRYPFPGANCLFRFRMTLQTSSTVFEIIKKTVFLFFRAFSVVFGVSSVPKREKINGEKIAEKFYSMQEGNV